MFPKRKWLLWEGASPADEDQEKRLAIESYMAWVVDRNEFYDEIEKLILDYIDFGNCFATVDWVDYTGTVEGEGNSSSPGKQVGYVGPMVRRISPLDLVFNPAASNFAETPKIVRSMISIGEVKEMLERNSINDQDKADAEELWSYMKEIRRIASGHDGTTTTKDRIYEVAGFGTYRDYLMADYAEVLTFYGDIYDRDTDTFKRNVVIKIVDRHKIISENNNPSYFGTAPIWHAGWRVRPDNLWAMGPLDNLVGMQYRIDHLENLKADVFDLVAFPLQKIKGYVDPFTWGPMEKVYVGDDGDVELMSPDVQALNADNQIAILEAKMEEMAGAPKEALGFRTPGEKTAYEVQRLENAASRIFQSKIVQFERTILEMLLNGMLESARRNLDKSTIRVFDNEFKIAVFSQLSAEDITGNGRLKPIAARHFAEQAQMVQNLTSFYGSAVGQDPLINVHFSGVQTARLFEHLLDLEGYNIVMPYIRLTEQSEAQKQANVNEEQVARTNETPAGIFPGDHDPEVE